MSFLRRLLAGTAPVNMEQATAKVQQLVDENKVVVFSKSWCGFCRMTKQTLDKMGVEYTAYELDTMSDGDDLQDALEQLTGQRTVPNTFISKKAIGGNSDLQSLQRQGKLEKMLRDAGAVKAEGRDDESKL